MGTDCASGSCDPGETRECYTAAVKDTNGVGPCHSGRQTCTDAGQWGNCDGEVIPVGEVCGDGIDNNCNGTVDENEDRDGDGFSTCDGDCCDSTECGTPGLVNPGAFDVPGNGVDDDCNGFIDDTPLLCDQGIASNTTNAKDFAKAIDICQEATMTDKKWGVIEASLTLPNGSGTPEAESHAVRPQFGPNALPRGGVSMAVLSTGVAAAKGDVNPNYGDGTRGGSQTSPFPADFVAAHAGKLPNAPGCPEPSGDTGQDPVMLTLKVRVPTNAHSFSLKSNFYSYEFPEYTCSPYNDFFVILLDSAYTGNPANPMDKNLAFYSQGGNNFPVGVNLAYGNTGLFTQCVNGKTGCATFSGAVPGTISTCTATTDLMGTGFDEPSTQCDSNSLAGGATGWLTTSGNVNPGEIITLRIAIWDTSDQYLDSTALIDGFAWSVDSSQPGTVILRADAPNNPKAVDYPYTSSMTNAAE